MEKFFNPPDFYRLFHAAAPLGISTVGYNDFHTVRAALAFHKQSACTLHFVVGGRGRLEIGEHVYYVQSGEMFFTPADTEMRYFPDPDDPWDYVWFVLKDTAGCRELFGFSPEAAVRPIPHFHKVSAILSRLLTALAAEEIGYFGVLAAFYEILDVCTAYAPQSGMRAVKALIDESFSLPSFRVEQLCRDVGISHAHLLRQFKAAYGVTVQRYVILRRIAFARELLRTTELSVASVALSCGFQDENHFMKTFKKEVGISALQYRKQQ
ncbi:MAG: helix-turn-helix domain-containing protein [Ruminococcaceae bacterium]|nr:helix-turn-helix domain-containing protein [Oscillospiraceae bacterium]